MQYYRINPIWTQLYGIRQALRQLQEFGRDNLAEVIVYPWATSARKKINPVSRTYGIRLEIHLQFPCIGNTRYCRSLPPPGSNNGKNGDGSKWEPQARFV